VSPSRPASQWRPHHPHKDAGDGSDGRSEANAAAQITAITAERCAVRVSAATSSSVLARCSAERPGRSGDWLCAVVSQLDQQRAQRRSSV